MPDDTVLAKVAAGLDIAGMANLTAWVHGDAGARLFGAEPVGLPTGAGYAAGVRIARSYLEAENTTAAHAVRTPASSIIPVGLAHLS